MLLPRSVALSSFLSFLHSDLFSDSFEHAKVLQGLGKQYILRSGPGVTKKIILNSAEHEIFHAKKMLKCQQLLAF